MSSYKNLVNVFGGAIAAFVAMPETTQMAQPKNLIPQIYIERAAPNRLILNSLFL